MRTVGVKLTADVSQYMTSLKRAGVATKDFAGGLDQAAKGGKLDKVSDQALRLGVVGVAAFGLVVKSAADFDKQMSSVAAATHAGAAEMGQLRAAALQAGKDTQFSATQAAQGIEELSKAGVSTANILGGGLKGALDLAAAGQLDVGEAAETAATAMTQFGLSGGQVPHVADLLAAAAGKAQGSVHDMGFALKQSGLVASQFGLSVEDTTGTLAAFASAGLIGSDAGTSFKTMLLALANPAEKTRDLMKQLGINAYDAQGNFVGITNLAGQLQTKLAGLTQAQRDAALAQIFGTDAIRAANVLYKQGSAGIQGWIDKTNDAGYAAETARIKTDNLAGDIERLKGSLETLAIESGSGANGGLRVLTKGLNDLVDQFGQMPSAVGGTLTVLAGVGGASLLALAGFIKVRKGIAEAVAQLNAMGPAGEKAATGLQKTASMAAKAAAAFAALEALGVIAGHFGAAAVNVDRLTASLTNLATTGKSAGELSDLFGKDMKNFADSAQAADAASHGFWGGLNDLTSAIPGVGNAVDALNEHIYGLSFNQAKDQMAGLNTALVDFMTTTNDAKKSSDLWNQMLIKSGLNTEQLAALLPDAYKKLGELNSAADKGGAALGTMSGAAAGTKAGIKGVGGAAAQTAEDLKKMTDAVEDAFGSQMSLDRAEIALRNGVVDLSKELHSGARSLSLNSAEGRKNRSAVLDQLGAIDDLRQSRIRHGMTLDAAQGKYTKDIAGLRKSMLQAGFSKKEVDKLIGSYKAIPSKVNTNVTVTGDKAAAAKLAALSIQQAALKKGMPISTSAARALAGDPKAAKQRGLLWTGGWTGPGPKYQPAGTVHADEYVVRKESRQPLEAAKPGALDYMNRTGRWPGYANGGRVVIWPFPVSAAMTRIPSLTEALSAVAGMIPAGGQTYKWIERAVAAAFPGMRILSDLRPGARTLSGAVSYHALGRAVDYPPSRPLAEWFNAKYFSRIKELISPYQDLNIHNGQRHTYTGAVWNQHNFAGGNAHDHVAMAGGGVIREPVWGYGASGRSYSFAENGIPETVISGEYQRGGGGGGTTYAPTYNITVTAAPLVHPAEVGAEVVSHIKAYERNNGTTWRTR